MKRNYESGAQKREAKRRKIAETARNSQRLSSWLTRPEKSEADEQDVGIRETASTPQFVDVSIRETDNLLKIDQMRAKMTTFPTIIVN